MFTNWEKSEFIAAIAVFIFCIALIVAGANIGYEFELAVVGATVLTIAFGAVFYSWFKHTRGKKPLNQSGDIELSKKEE